MSKTTWLKFRPDAPATPSATSSGDWLESMQYTVPQDVVDRNNDLEREVLVKIGDATGMFQRLVNQGGVIDIMQYLNTLRRAGVTGDRRNPSTNMQATVSATQAIQALKM